MRIHGPHCENCCVMAREERKTRRRNPVVCHSAAAGIRRDVFFSVVSSEAGGVFELDHAHACDETFGLGKRQCSLGWRYLVGMRSWSCGNSAVSRQATREAKGN